ncbi:hypothetical protein DPMN_164433 [Dreissena polymorpha]|uniref:Uncharacterized protein n=1 Tax=Dreissena polymorpha TaxID=45954 RepID=A0A9D4EXU1_DREPO|nr:hypothetical protein DPMN_164433 [Dreissena polymorpha]
MPVTLVITSGATGIRALHAKELHQLLLHHLFTCQRQEIVMRFKGALNLSIYIAPLQLALVMV